MAEVAGVAGGNQRTGIRLTGRGAVEKQLLGFGHGFIGSARGRRWRRVGRPWSR
ncbi:predicted protein [Streptomyces viridosporus ATCC 14672]|uniref:Predicted protein n=1 Tax=Streptomyces viridosporus (strain ATCC 14672 / DSM 40746 / JCM 4963 / KCTC 9882 / NRRL B-12104 / FH 1290) TaxID=566461 RepID=D5ZSS1_STRV1|nr:predicted protein [Streptomyces viridosporus ATCC 14672]